MKHPRAAAIGRWRAARRGKLLRIAVWAAGLLALWAIVGFLLLPRIVRPVLERKLAEALHRPVAIRRLSINPFALSATLRGVTVGQRRGPGDLLSFRSLYVNLEAVSLLRRTPVVRQVTLESPRLALIRYEDGTYNFSDLLGGAPAGAPGKEPARFSVNNIRVTGGSIDFDDRPMKAKQEVRDLNVGIPFLSNVPSKVEIFTQPSFSAKVNGSPIVLRGETKPFAESRETSVTLDVADVDLPRYLAYLPGKLPARLSSGRFGAKLTLTFLRSPGGRSGLLLTGTASLRDAAVLWRDHPLLSLRRLDAAIGSYDIFQGRLRLTSVAAIAPQLDLRRLRDGQLEVASALGTGRAAAPPERKKEKGTGFTYSVGEFRVENGTIRYSDASLASPFRATLSPIGITVRNLSSVSKTPATLSIAARSDAGETLRHDGTFTLAPFSAQGSVALDGVPLRRYAPWYERTLLADLDGSIDLSGRYALSGGPAGDTTLSGVSAALHAVRARKRGAREPFLAIPAATLDGAAMDLSRRTVSLGSLATSGGLLAVRREEDGSIDLGKLIAPAPAAKATGATAPASSPSWTLSVGKLAAEKYTIRIDDLAPGTPAHLVLSPASIVLENFATSGPGHGNLAASFVLNRQGLATVSGPVGISPVFADLRVRVKDLGLVPIEPYIFSQIRLSLVRGTLNGSGTLGFRPGPGGAASVTFSGNAAVRNAVAVEEESKEDFLRWDSVSVRGLSAGYNPVFARAKSLDASGVVCHIGIAEDGTVNLRTILEPREAPVKAAAKAPPAPPPAPPPPAAPAGRVTPIRVDAVTLAKSEITLTDHLVKPHFSARLQNVGGSIRGLSSAAGTKAEVDLHGSLEGASPLEIRGTVNPLAATQSAAIRASFRDIDLVPMTPYFGKYAGYAVARGKLTMNVDYRLANRKLQAQNRFVVDQFTFGDKMESPTATKLPVRLAVSLLKDRNGVIDLDLPVSGSLDDPKFRIGPIVWKMLGNLLAKAITSPFSLLGRLFGGGAELSYVEFDPGSEAIGAPAARKLDALATALYERPALKLEIQGRADAGSDEAGLKRALFARKVKAQKMAELQKKGSAPASLDEVTVTPEEWPAFLKKAYKKEKFKKPRTFLGFAKDIPPDEMEKLMLANIRVGPEELRQLALARAQAVKSYLLATKKVDAERIFLLEPGAAPAKPPEGAKGSRVDFTLK